MNVSITKEEFEAIMFCKEQVVSQVEASNNIAMLESPVKLAISLRGPCSVAEEYITPYLDAETTLYIKNAILRSLNGRIAFFKKEIEDINYTKRKTKKK